MPKKLLVEEIDKRVCGKLLKRIEDYVDYHTPILWQCLKKECEYEWKARPADVIFKNSGCPKCKQTLPLTNELVDERLKGRGIRRLDDIVGTKAKIRWKCLVKDCGYEWITSPSNVLNNGCGCSKCYGNIPYTNKDIDLFLSKRNITRLSNINGIKNQMKFKCLIMGCGHEWETAPHNLLSRNSGCPKCSRCICPTDKEVDDRLIDRKIQRLCHIENTHKKYEWRCLNEKCGCIWKANLNNISRGTGCPNCQTLKTQKMIYNYLQAIIDIKFIRHNNKKIYYNNNNNNNNKNYFRLDFFIEPNIIIEYNGIQHYKPNKFFGGEDHFKIQQLRDANLRKYCFEHNFPLLEIPYTMKEAEWKIVIKEFLMNNCKELLKDL